MEALAGMQNVLKVLNATRDTIAKKAAKGGVNAGLQVLAKGVRSEINSAPVSPELKAAARKTVAKRLKKKEGQDYVGKVGFGVGKQGKRKKETAHARNMRGQGSNRETRGVGVSASNIHWFVLGTKERVAGIKGVSSSTIEHGRVRQVIGGYHATGKIEPLLAGAVERASSGADAEVLDAMRARVTQILESEVAKSRR